MLNTYPSSTMTTQFGAAKRLVMREALRVAVCAHALSRTVSIAAHFTRAAPIGMRKRSVAYQMTGSDMLFEGHHRCLYCLELERERLQCMMAL